ncbi:Fanconi anemia group D2 protein-like isoform X2 [Acropora millepora]|uniref:Fanconi anemia group D2 protein-like isoform X2 n=1 Tax=Acropora millepora TaxID=45264 RepID=UPI001CF45718|nr:Fanconi anemia group D2 protein-like isoform X2 [Acropora millepora]
MVRSKRRISKPSHGEPSAKRSKQSSSEARKNAAAGIEATLFSKIVEDAGLQLNSDATQDELVGRSVFQNRINKLLKGHPSYPEIIDDFIEGFEERLQDPNRFQLSLLPVSISADHEGCGGSPESLTRMLLSVDILQPKIANILLEKLPEFMGDEDSNRADGINIPRLVLNQFRWMDCVVQSKELTEKMFEMVGVTSLEVQREIIACIPEVLDDSEHTEVARELSELLLQNTELTVAILDALSNLNLRPELLSEVRSSVIQMLPSVELDDLPVVVKFILQSVGDNDAFEVISELRSNLSFSSTSLPPTACSTPAEQRRSHAGSLTSKNKHGELFTLDAIRSGIRFQKSVAEGWTKAIESANTPGNHKVVDLFVLLILHSTANRKKAMETLIRNKIKNGHFTEEMLNAAFSSHSQILREYFSDLLSLAEILLRSPDPSVSSYACEMYKLSFISFDLYCQQEIVGTLVTHIGSGFASEADASLDVLSDLVESHPDVMAPFAIFIKGILDYLDNLTVTQIRKLFDMLSTLAFASRQDGGLIQDDMHIVITKQLTSNSPKYKRIGIIGAIMVVRSMAKKRIVEEGSEETMGDTESQRQSTLSDEAYKQVTSMLDLIRNRISQAPEAAALFYDELARIIQLGGIDPKIESWISDTVVGDFQDDFLIDREAPVASESVPLELCYALDESEEGSIAVNLLPLLLAARNSATNKNKTDRSAVSLICLAPHFRLLRVCEESQRKGDLEGIDALLGCPLVSIKQDILKEIETLDQADREIICGALFFTVNWFREVVNAFAPQRDPEMRGKSISRLQTITELHEILEKFLAVTPSFKPPLASFDFEDSLVANAVSRVNGSKTKQGKKAKSKGDVEKADDSIEKEAEKENANDKEDATQIDTAKNTKEKDKTTSPLVSMTHYRAFLRELDLKAFGILECELVSRAVLDSEMNTEETTILRLQAPQLEFLLEDLSRKLQHSLSASASSRRTFLKVRHDKLVGFSNLSRYSSKDVATFVVDLLPSLCEHLEATSAFFQGLMAQSDGLLDGPGYNTTEASTMASCFRLLFSCLQYLFAWSGFLMSQHQALLKKALFVLSSRIKLSSKSQPGLQELLKQSFHYLEQFCASVPNINTAVSLTKLLVVLCERQRDDNSNMNTSLADLTGTFLKREWIRSDGEKETGAKFNEALQFLLRFHLSCAADTLATIEEIAGGAMTSLVEDDEKDACSEAYPTLTRSSLACFYRVMMEELVSNVKQTHSVPLRTSDPPESHKERLVKLNIAVRIFHIMINLVKAFNQRRGILGASLKYGRLFVEIFLKLGMPTLDFMFRTHKDDIHGLLKNLQQSTRSLQHFCGHSKVTKDLSLTNHVPAVKKCLETFVFRVKAMLALNKCHEAFWLGNLKNRDIHGEVISSQQSNATEDDKEQDEEAEEMEDDDDDEDETEENESKNGDEQSCSESF